MEVLSRRSFFDRMKGAALLEVPVYEEVEADESATGQAALVVGIVAIAAAIGGARGGVGGVVGGLIGAFVGWLLWSGITYLIGSWLGGTATWGELLRTIGFAQSPGVLLILAFIPVLGWLVSLIVAVWLLIAGVVAIRQALDFGTGKALITALLGFIAYIVLAVLLRMLLHVPGNVL